MSKMGSSDGNCHRCGHDNYLFPDDDGKNVCTRCYSKYRSEEMYQQKTREKSLKELLNSDKPWYKRIFGIWN